ncbi:MAG: hypothetical protein NTW28_02315 [Candidatus Solibacter sp.]|nr:hypothetical protein [Candidatus Solibacter sp.]
MKQRYLSARRWRDVAVALSALSLLAAGTSCSSGPQPLRPGTPAFYWSAARETYRAGDFLKTSENLQRILTSENEFTARARAWDTVISAGMTQGYIELADAWEAGARSNRLDPTPFRKQVTTLRTLASAAAIQFTENAHKLMDANKDPDILLAFGYPAGAAAPPAGLKRMSGGILVQDTERDLLQTAMLQRGVLLSVCGAVGAPDDGAAAQEKLKTGEFRVPRGTFVLAVAKSLQAQSELFTGTKLDQPNKLKLMSQEALEALKSLPPTKETKSLTDKIQARLKKARITL